VPLGALDFAHPALPTALSAAAVGELASAPALAPRLASRRAPHFAPRSHSLLPAHAVVGLWWDLDRSALEREVPTLVSTETA